MISVNCSFHEKKDQNQSFPDFIYDDGFIADGFDFPVGKPDGNGYYNAQPFQENHHLGEDWNGKGGGNTDFGDTVYAIGNGYVSFASDAGTGWGNVVRIIHRLNNDTLPVIESLYAHCHEMKVNAGDFVKRGQAIGTIGNADGRYLAHLHFELRSQINMELGGGYSSDTQGFLNPTDFISANRP